MKTMFKHVICCLFAVASIGALHAQTAGVRLLNNGDAIFTGSTPGIFFREVTTNNFYGALEENSDDIRLSAAIGNLLFRTAGDDRLSITQAGRVGIGTTDPSESFEVRGDIEIEGAFPFLVLRPTADNSQNLGVQMKNTAGTQIAAIFYDDTNNEIVLENGSGSAGDVVIESSGRTGFGTSTAAGKIEAVFNSGQGIPHLMLSENSLSDFARITFRNTAAAGNDYWDIAGKAAGNANDPFFNLFYFNGTTGNNFFSIDRNNSNIEVDGDMIPFDVAFDVGNNNAAEHWDDCVADDFINFSDKRLKQNIKSLDEILPMLMQLNPVTYEFKPAHNIDGRKRTGFIAQEVQEIFPTVIVTEDVDRDAITGEVIKYTSDYLSMNYIELIPITIKALQEQQEMIGAKDKQLEEQENRITQLEAELADIKAMLLQLADGGKVDISNQTSTLTSATLEQNQPNPFTENTMIRYFIPEGVKTAALKVTNLEGKVIKDIAIQQRGEGQVSLQANSLSAGTYQYMLVLDGQILETKQMILTRN